MAGGGILELTEDEIKMLSEKAWKAHKSASYLVEKNSKVIISFPRSGSIKDWFSGNGKPFGETEIDLTRFPSMKSVGNNKTALVNEAFQKRFQDMLSKPAFKTEVYDAINKKRQLVFTGHSSGAPMAILATLWFLETYPTSNPKPLCVTFGSPLIGNHIFSHAIRREKWSPYFIHFVMRYDIVPRILLAPRSSFEEKFEKIYQFLNSKPKSSQVESIGRDIVSDFYFAVMSNAAAVQSYAACKLMGNKNASLETVASFIALSPYRPFGTYVFCHENKKFIVTSNPDVALQIMFFSAQLNTEAELAEVAHKSLTEHLIHDFRKSFQVQNVLELDGHEEIPLSADNSTINTALNDLGLCTRARLCVLAAKESEKQKLRNQDRMNAKKDDIEGKIKEVEEYKSKCEIDGEGYYDSFKLQTKDEDFKANVKRLELEALWNEIIDMLYKYELPDEFESNDEWVKLGTSFRHILEPLDIANYYRHARDKVAGPYMENGRPRRYKYAQNWQEHSSRKRLPGVTSMESCYWAELEELIRNKEKTDKEKILQIETWYENEELPKDVFFKKSTFVKWRETLPQQLRQASSLPNVI
ncbi:hypothetical protein L6164_014652 [Bauhinia variegata]|uniref:Uncharacterized protein n=1 Tax=Bauhinia variegata TaxID=167791 RepID=A0ACB9NJF9_BAUVA|nr:hypothetical protein L6164_014652 [Bauhinia variegata]